MEHKAGFVNIIGRPNVGKSTLLNALMGQKLAIVTHKAQTTRHRILAFLNGDDYQIVFSDTPGILKPNYKLHERMMGYVGDAMADADVLLLMTDINENIDSTLEFPEWQKAIKLLKNKEIPVILLVNKIDLAESEQQTTNVVAKWRKKLAPIIGSEEDLRILPISASDKSNLIPLLDEIIQTLPESPAFYPKDMVTDKPERFIVSEVIREKIFFQFKEEIPYSSEVSVIAFKEDDNIIKIDAEIVVERASQKPIIIGKNGKAIKKIGINARKDLEDFFAKKIFLNLYVKVRDDWRDKNSHLRNFGYV